MNQNDAHAISRRDALRRLALLPIELCGLTTLAAVFKTPYEEILTQCSAGIIACKYLSKGQHDDLVLAASVISTYLPTLRAIVKNVPLYRMQAAHLTAQALLINAILSAHSQGPKQAARYAEQALIYSDESDDLSLHLIILEVLAWIYACDKQKKQALETVLRAEQLLEQATVPIVSAIKCDIYSGIAKYRAQSGQNDQALAALYNTHEAFFTPHDEDNGSAYADYDYSSLLMDDGLTYYHTGQYEQAFVTFSQAIDPETLIARTPANSERERTEIINHQTLALLKSPKKDMELSIKLWKAGILGAIDLQSEQRFTEATNAFEIMEGIWSGDKRIGELRDLIIHW